MGMSDSIVHGRLTVRSSPNLARVVIEALEDPNPPEPAVAMPGGTHPDEEKARIHDEAAQREQEIAIQTLHEEVARWSSQIPAQLNRYFEELESRVRAEVVDLSLQIARMILGADAPRQSALRAALNEVFIHVVRENEVQIRLHPEDASRMTDVDQAQWPAAATCIPDPTLQPGDVVVSTDQGLLDATLNGRMDMLEDTIREILSVEEGENECHPPSTD